MDPKGSPIHLCFNPRAPGLRFGAPNSAIRGRKRVFHEKSGLAGVAFFPALGIGTLEGFQNFFVSRRILLRAPVQKLPKTGYRQGGGTTGRRIGPSLASKGPSRFGREPIWADSTSRKRCGRATRKGETGSGRGTYKKKKKKKKRHVRSCSFMRVSLYFLHSQVGSVLSPLFRFFFTN